MADLSSYTGRENPSVPILPNTTSQLDNQIEDAGLQSTALFGNASNMKNWKVSDDNYVRYNAGYIKSNSPGTEITYDYGIRIYDENGDIIFQFLPQGIILDKSIGSLKINGSIFFRNLSDTLDKAEIYYNEGLDDLTIDASSLVNGILLKGDTYVLGDFGASGTKSFRIKHPDKEGYDLKYNCPESPEVLLMCRGNGEVILPDHFVSMTEPDSLQTIKDKDNGNWLVTGIRKGYKDFNPEIPT